MYQQCVSSAEEKTDEKRSVALWQLVSINLWLGQNLDVYRILSVEIRLQKFMTTWKNGLVLTGFHVLKYRLLFSNEQTRATHSCSSVYFTIS